MSLIKNDDCQAVKPLDEVKTVCECQANRQKLKTDFTELLTNHSIEMISYVKGRLIQYKLLDADPFEILNITYVRLYEKVCKWEPIRNLKAMTKSVAFKVVRELSREKGKQQEECSNFYSFGNQIASLYREQEEDECELKEAENKSKLMEKAMAQLPDKDRKILEWQVVEEFSWRKVKSRLVSDGYVSKDVDISTLRKQGERARRKLKELCNSIYAETLRSEKTHDNSMEEGYK